MKNITYPLIKLIQSLKQKKTRYQHKLYWVEGLRNINSLIQAKSSINFIVLSDKTIKEKLTGYNSLEIYHIKERDISRIKATSTFPGIGAVVLMPESAPLKSMTIILLDGINDPGNLGTIIRSACWFGIHDFILTAKTADPFNEKCVRASMGAVASANFIFAEDIKEKIKEFKDKGYTLIAADLSGEDLPLNYPEKKIIVFGNEANGISKDILCLSDLKIKIPGDLKIESLNVAVASGIILFSQFKP